MKRVGPCVIAGILTLLIVAPGLSRPLRVWDWESILLSRSDNVFAATYYKVSLGGSVPITLGEDIKNATEEMVEDVIEATDVAMDWLEDKVEEYQLGPALSVFIPGPGVKFPGPGLNFTAD